MRGFLSSFSLHALLISAFCYSTSFATAAVDFTATGNAIEVGLLNLSQHNERKFGAINSQIALENGTQEKAQKEKTAQKEVKKPLISDNSLAIKSNKTEEIEEEKPQKEEITQAKEVAKKHDIIDEKISIVETALLGSNGLGVIDINNAGQTSGNNASINSGELGSNARVLNFSPPRYPDSARRAEEEGIVSIEVYTNAKGKIENLHILKSSGFERLDTITLKAVEKAKFAQSEGRVVISVTFRLDD